MLLDIKTIKEHPLTISPVIAGDDEPKVIAWQVAVMYPTKIMGHYMGRTHPDSGVSAPTLEEALVRLESKLGERLVRSPSVPDPKPITLPVVAAPERAVRR